MISARQALFSAARGFFETEIAGLYRWDDVQAREPEPSDPDPKTGKVDHWRKHKERVVISFDEFRLELDSPEECPPLGQVRLYVDNEKSADGPLDVSTWAKVGDAIRERCDVS